jgi:hypothetical protein
LLRRGEHGLEVHTFRAPPHYRGVGTVMRAGNRVGLPPGELNVRNLKAFACLREDLVDVGKINTLLWNDAGTGSKTEFSAWSITIVQNKADKIRIPGEGWLRSMRLNSGSFVANGNHHRPEDSRAFVIRFYVMPDDMDMWLAKATRSR